LRERGGQGPRGQNPSKRGYEARRVQGCGGATLCKTCGVRSIRSFRSHGARNGQAAGGGRRADARRHAGYPLRGAGWPCDAVGCVMCLPRHVTAWHLRRAGQLVRPRPPLPGAAGQALPGPRPGSLAMASGGGLCSSPGVARRSVWMQDAGRRLPHPRVAGRGERPSLARAIGKRTLYQNSQVCAPSPEYVEGQTTEGAGLNGQTADGKGMQTLHSRSEHPTHSYYNTIPCTQRGRGRARPPDAAPSLACAPAGAAYSAPISASAVS
jgi:hypothetical protein